MIRKIKASESVLFFLLDEEPDGISVLFTGPCSVLDVAMENAIEMAHSCGGNGTCGTCRVEVVDPPPDLEGRNEIELEMAQDRGFHVSERLACQLTARNGLKVRIP